MPLRRRTAEDHEARRESMYFPDVGVRSYLRTSPRGALHPVRRHYRRQAWGIRAGPKTPEVMYHLTPENQVENVLRHGLRPGPTRGQNFMELAKRTGNRVFLVPTMMDLRYVQDYMPRDRSAILAVDVSDLPLYMGDQYPRYLGFEGRPFTHREFYTTRNIPPSRIRVVGSMEVDD